MKDRLNKLLGRTPAPAYNMGLLMDQVAAVKKNTDYIAITPQPTAGNWQGINNAARQLFGAGFLEIPQYYSNQVLSDAHLQHFAAEIKRLQFSNVILNGFPPYFEKLVNALAGCRGIKISTVLHGTFSEMGHGDKSQQSIALPLQLIRQNKLHKIGAVRKDVADFIAAKWRCNAFALINKCNAGPVTATYPRQAGRNYIGVFGGDFFNKNLHNQVCGATLIGNSTIVVNNASLFGYLHAPVEGTDNLDRESFLSVLASMDVNLHLSFSESWGQIAAESLAVGVPCLVSPNTNILDNDPGLREQLTVARIDSPGEIAGAIKRVLDNREALGRQGIAYMAGLNQQADILLQQFLLA